MRVDIDKTLRTALRTLEAEKVRLDRQIAALKGALDVTSRRNASSSMTRGTTRTRGAVPASERKRRRRMSRAARRAVSQHMKAYWAKRRVQLTKAKNSRAA
jgi:hypothetical protein